MGFTPLQLAWCSGGVSSGRYDRGSPRTLLATKALIMLLFTGATRNIRVSRNFGSTTNRSTNARR
jgi:hypothetical protein